MLKHVELIINLKTDSKIFQRYRRVQTLPVSTTSQMQRKVLFNLMAPVQLIYATITRRILVERKPIYNHIVMVEKEVPLKDLGDDKSQT